MVGRWGGRWGGGTITLTHTHTLCSTMEEQNTLTDYTIKHPLTPKKSTDFQVSLQMFSPRTGRVLDLLVVLTGLKVGEGGVASSRERHHLGNHGEVT